MNIYIYIYMRAHVCTSRVMILTEGTAPVIISYTMCVCVCMHTRTCTSCVMILTGGNAISNTVYLSIYLYIYIYMYIYVYIYDKCIYIYIYIYNKCVCTYNVCVAEYETLYIRLQKHANTYVHVYIRIAHMYILPKIFWYKE